MTTTTAEKLAKGPLTTFKEALALRQSHYAAMMPTHLRGLAPRFTQGALIAATNNPIIAQCSPITLYKALDQCAQLGLDPSGILGSSYLVPYRNKKTGGYDCQLIIGYRGMIDLARRSGQVISIYAEVVREGDVFKHTLGTDPKIVHEPIESDDENRKLSHAYAVAKLVGGGEQFVVLTANDIKKIMASSQSAKSEFSPWTTHPDEMGKKSAIRRLFKMLPMSVELMRAQDLDDKVENPEIVHLADFETIEETPAEPASSKTADKVADAIRGKKAPDTVPMWDDVDVPTNNGHGEPE